VVTPLSRNLVLCTLLTAATCGRANDFSTTVPQDRHRGSSHYRASRSTSIPSQRLPLGDTRRNVQANGYENNDFHSNYNNVIEHEQDGLEADFGESWYPSQPPLQPSPFEPYDDPQPLHHGTTTADTNTANTRLPPPPPPPPQLPIHYAFPAANQSPPPPLNDDNAMVATTTTTTGSEIQHESALPHYASARRDVVTTFITAKFSNRILLLVSAMAWGYGLSLFVSRSLLGNSSSMGGTANTIVAVVFGLALTLRNNVYGEWIRALAMLLILSLQKWHDIRRTYPTQRILWNNAPFPPRTVNPWAWENAPHQPCEFFMVYSVVAMAVVGAIVGANVPIILIPSSLLALVGAMGAAYVTTLPHSATFSYGSVARCMGMRVVALVRISVSIERDVQLGRHSAAVAGKLLDTLLILDRKHRLKDKLVAATSWIMAVIARIQQDASNRNSVSPTATGAVPTSDRDSSRRYYDPTTPPQPNRSRPRRPRPPGASSLPPRPKRFNEDGRHHYSSDHRRESELFRDDNGSTSSTATWEYIDGREYGTETEPWSERPEQLQPGAKQKPPPSPESSKAKTGPPQKRWFS
jgi:hypothetical protein